eukprot:TRINITY_DN12012_c1_g2_i2.p3 TRINITY_DN12012_c1_g2~~TRINITY_DN12012_c1_g2_i2.p3  ORF type:complete len:188 (-),score=15.46 TRINITY_DN12012_c1_g2_i2:335-898(-)
MGNIEDRNFVQNCNKRLSKTTNVQQFTSQNLYLLLQARQLLHKTQNQKLYVSGALFKQIQGIRDALKFAENCASQQVISDVGRVFVEIGEVLQTNTDIINDNDNQILRCGFPAQFLIKRNQKQIAVFVDCDSSFSVGQKRELIGEALARNRITKLYGYDAVVVDEEEWLTFDSEQQKIEYLQGLLQR